MNFKTYSTYNTEDFLEEEAFRNWVQAPTKFTDNYWKEFLELYPEQTEKIAQARQLLLRMEDYFELPEEAPAIEESFLADLKLAMHETKQEQAQEVEKVAKRTILSRKWEMAATVLLLIASSFGVWKVAFNTNFQNQHIAHYGEWKTIDLPDGSTVYLNANSSLQLTDNWDAANNRKVRLDGEAYFEVAKKPLTQAKFQVITEDLTIEVLGTQFNVNTKSANTEVFLEEGKIKLDLGESATMMAPGDFIAYSKSKQQIVERKKMQADLPGAWRSGVVTIKNKTVTEIAETIENIYGLHIVLLNDTLKTEIRTIAIPIDRLELAIPILETTLQATIERKGNQLIVK